MKSQKSYIDMSMETVVDCMAELDLHSEDFHEDGSLIFQTPFFSVKGMSSDMAIFTEIDPEEDLAIISAHYSDKVDPNFLDSYYDMINRVNVSIPDIWVIKICDCGSLRVDSTLPLGGKIISRGVCKNTIIRTIASARNLYDFVNSVKSGKPPEKLFDDFAGAVGKGSGKAWSIFEQSQWENYRREK